MKALEILKDLLINMNALDDDGYHFGKYATQEAINELEALQQPKSCKWEQCDTVFDTSWEGTCGAKWTIEHGTPKENHMSFCPQCGGKLTQIETKEQ